MHALARASLPLYAWALAADCLWLCALGRARRAGRRARVHRSTCLLLLGLHAGAAALLQTGVLPALPQSAAAVRHLALAAACSSAQAAALHTLAAAVLFDARALPRMLRAGALATALVSSASCVSALCLLDMRVRSSGALAGAVALHAAVFVGAAVHVESLLHR